MKYSHHLYKYIQHRQMNAASFAESLGLSRPDRLYNVLKGKNGLSEKFASLISSKYNDLNYDWLLTGEGEMIKMEGKQFDENIAIKDQKSVPAKRNYKQMYAVADDNTIYPIQDGVTQIDDSAHMEVEFRDLSVAAGPLSRTAEPTEKKTLLVPKEYDNGEYLVVRVDGNSMEDGTEYSIPGGANILIKRLHLEYNEKLPIRGNLFVIDARDGQALKQIVDHNQDEGYVVCHSYNPDYKDYKVMIEDVFDFYIYRKIVGYRPPVRDIN